MNEKQKEWKIIRGHGIVFVTAILPDQFPAHLSKTFQRIRSFRKFDLATLYPSASPLTPEQIFWKDEITNRAKRITAIAARLIEDAPSEAEVRLRMEQMVLERFNMVIECPTCKRRLWRSEVEVEVESPHRIATSLQSRRPDRLPCQCSQKEVSSHINKMFSTRADQMISCDFFDTGSEDHAKRRRPDRILGFQETGSFSRRLEKYNLTAGRSENEAGFESILGALKSTVLNHEGNSLLFPFLIIEAKKRDSASFDDCNMQSALPILEMLKVQEDMQRKSQMTLEYGGPLVWYIAYRGEDWRLSGCYISEKPGPASYEIVTLWTGQLNDVESALQLLLIIDYIFDWARDIYRPSLISQLEMLAKEPSEDDDEFTGVDTDSDIFSLAKPRPRQYMNVEDWATDLENDTEMVVDEEHDVMKWGAHDSELGVFRPASIVQNFFSVAFSSRKRISTSYFQLCQPKRGVRLSSLPAKQRGLSITGALF